MFASPSASSSVAGSSALALPQPQLPFVAQAHRDYNRVRSLLSSGYVFSAAPASASTSAVTGGGSASSASASASGSATPVSLAIIVPFRNQKEQNRMQQLERFAAAMPLFLARARSKLNVPIAHFHVFIIEQSNDGFKFNRGKLLNAGYVLASQPDLLRALGVPVAPGLPYNAFCFHDVDLLPGPELGYLYAAYPHRPLHIGNAWPRYVKPGYKYVGGILTLSKETMERCNGFPNNFWGWGGEDDVLSDRLERIGAGAEVERPGAECFGRVTDLEEVLTQELGSGVRASASVKAGGSIAFKCMWKTELRKFHAESGHFEGIATLDFALVGKRAINDHVTVLTVDLKAASDPAGEKFSDGGENVGLKVSDSTIQELFDKLAAAYGMTKKTT